LEEISYLHKKGANILKCLLMKRLCIVFILLLWTIVSSSQLAWINYENSGHYNDAFTTIGFDNQNNPWSGTILNGVHYHNGS
jgi:hypothetical protein